MTVRITPLKGIPASALMERMVLDGSGPGIGVLGLPDMKVTSGAGFSSVIAPGHARIRADQAGAGTDSGMQEILVEASEPVTHSNPDATNPRIDAVYARLQDASLSGATNLASVGIATGTPTGGTTTLTRNGAAALPLGCVLLADVLVPNGVGSSASFSYLDRRQFASYATVPPVRFQVDQAALVYPWNLTNESLAFAASSSQGSAMAYLSRKITATRIRWMYRQGSTAMTGNYNIGIYDSSGRKIVETGAIALTGAANSFQPRSEPISSTIFEPGVYYVVFGWSTLASGSVDFGGIMLVAVATLIGGFGPNVVGVTRLNGTTLQTSLSHVDLGGTFTPESISLPAVTLTSA